jgi:hypothetical protein
MLLTWASVKGKSAVIINGGSTENILSWSNRETCRRRQQMQQKPRRCSTRLGYVYLKCDNLAELHKIWFSVPYIPICASLWPATYKHVAISFLFAKIRHSSVRVVTQCPNRLRGLTCIPTIQHRQLCAVKWTEREAGHSLPARAYSQYVDLHFRPLHVFTVWFSIRHTNNSPNTVPLPWHLKTFTDIRSNWDTLTVVQQTQHVRSVNRHSYTH